ncbi:hypothetical protein J5N97_016447 [Dioscorea zingiberensis]|uniref:Uncharacterized protein n=1 Tax=Dioscorea zingiberensis TaxID=325984 RepID=A0A9D5CJU4_9LILI|nr:hypothetical protein J5N97_016447 [Dioscorea zingiberensis]
MGGCASKPKELNGQNTEELPAEALAAAPEVKPVEGDVPAETKAEEAKKEEPLLVDLSEPKPEESKSEPVGEQLSPDISDLKPEPPVEVKDKADEEKTAKPVEKAPAKEAVKDEAVVAAVVTAEKVEQLPAEEKKA